MLVCCILKYKANACTGWNEATNHITWLEGNAIRLLHEIMKRDSSLKSSLVCDQITRVKHKWVATNKMKCSFNDWPPNLEVDRKQLVSLSSVNVTSSGNHTIPTQDRPVAVELEIWEDY